MAVLFALCEAFCILQHDGRRTTWQLLARSVTAGTTGVRSMRNIIHPPFGLWARPDPCGAEATAIKHKPSMLVCLFFSFLLSLRFSFFSQVLQLCLPKVSPGAKFVRLRVSRPTKWRSTYGSTKKHQTQFNGQQAGQLHTQIPGQKALI